MFRCTCATRALESFVKDFAGINLHRQQRAQQFFQQARTFGRRASLWQQTDASKGDAAGDSDGWIPFDGGRGGEKDESVVTLSPRDLNNTPQEAKNTVESEEWHAEVQITDPEALATRHEEDTVDRVTLRSLSANAGSEGALQRVRVLELPAISQHFAPRESQAVTVPEEATPQQATKPTVQAEPRTRAESRYVRRLRRIQDGKFMQLAMARHLGKQCQDQAREAENGPQEESWHEGARSKIEGPQEHIGGKKEKGKNARKRERRAREAEEVRETSEADPSKDENKLDRSAASPASKKEKTGKAVVPEPKPAAAKKKPSTTPKGPQQQPPPTKQQSQPSRLKKEPWQVQKAALTRKFGEQGWSPRKRVSPDTLEGIRALHASDPSTYSTETLSNHFQISADAIRRILKSKWKPKPEEIEERAKRWEKRGVKKWAEMSEKMGTKPPKKWRELGVENVALRRRLERKPFEQERQRRSKMQEARDNADRLPMEGSFAERIL
ncbi:Hypothetical predicted protein [Lecanosticta acicola]|uniref:Required for respiratory growth protein 9, mitochondrial n=1 Tax=Lecanosticta acicola TaxID=111012 RepID=A0AAI8Z163_9PEZI|nr:Hypothetical predicted protein [Lecanosticta acicola]